MLKREGLGRTARLPLRRPLLQGFDSPGAASAQRGGCMRDQRAPVLLTQFEEGSLASEGHVCRLIGTFSVALARFPLCRIPSAVFSKLASSGILHSSVSSLSTHEPSDIL